MKKTYITPAIQVVRLQQQTHLLAGSLRGSISEGLSEKGQKQDEDELPYDMNGGDISVAW
jgi:hypothetical protein